MLVLLKLITLIFVYILQKIELSQKTLCKCVHRNFAKLRLLTFYVSVNCIIMRDKCLRLVNTFVIFQSLLCFYYLNSFHQWLLDMSYDFLLIILRYDSEKLVSMLNLKIHVRNHRQIFLIFIKNQIITFIVFFFLIFLFLLLRRNPIYCCQRNH